MHKKSVTKRLNQIVLTSDDDWVNVERNPRRFIQITQYPN